MFPSVHGLGGSNERACGRIDPMVAFTCNICGASNEVETFATEPASCACGSNVRLRALIHLLSMELFGQSLCLADFPQLKAIRGLGMTDKDGYARILAEKFDYTNTFYDCEPRFDFTESHPELYGTYDFILSADVLEHIAPPVELALEEIAQLLKPRGFLGATIYCNPADQLREHFPSLNEFRIVRLGDSPVLVNRRRDGGFEVIDNLVFHGGSGATLEMREFGAAALKGKLMAAGFREVHLHTDDLPAIGVIFDHDVSQPLIARKERFVLEPAAQTQLVEQWRAAEQRSREARESADSLAARIRLAAESKWLKLGRRLGLGPDLA
jgi:SAM-dependent methyltransferase